VAAKDSSLKMLPKFIKALWGIIIGFRPLNLLLIFGVHKIIQWVMIGHGQRLKLDINQTDLFKTLDQLMWASIALAAAGYLINDYYDQRADSINKPKRASHLLISHHIVFWSFWAGINLIAFSLGFSIDRTVEHSSYGALFILISLILFGYNLSKWSKFLIGPVVISGLVALNPILAQDLALTLYTKALTNTSFNEVYNLIAPTGQWIWRIAFLGFLSNFIRELIKDIEDINGDQNAGRRTLPIVLGIERTAKITAVFGLILVLILGMFAAIALNSSIPLGINLTLALILAIWITYKSAKIERPSQAKSLSLTLKLLLILGLMSLFWL